MTLGDGLATLYHANSLDLAFADDSPVLSKAEGFDALLTDPPYGMGYVSHHRSKRKPVKGSWDPRHDWQRYMHGESFAPISGDDTPFDPAHWLALAGKRQLVLWGANYYADRLPASGHWMIWDKREGTRPNDQADCEMAWTNLKGGPRLYSHLWIGLCRRGEENLSCGGRKLHPNQKPVAVMDWMLDQCKLRPGQTVLDPYMGSASLGVACIRRGLRYIGCEIDENYFHIACERLEKEAGKVAVSGFTQPQPAWASGQTELFGELR